VSSDGTTNYVLQENNPEYRSYFMSTLYGGANFTYGLLDSAFQDPPQGTGASAYQYDPTGSAWSFSGSAGVAGNGSTITSGNPNAPEGTQVAFLQGTATISQAVNFLTAGAYQLSLLAAQSGNNNTSSEKVRVLVDGAVVATFAPTSTSYATYTTPSFNVTAGSHTIAFVGVDPSGASDTALVNVVGLSAFSIPGTASFVKTDTATQGSWQGVYGSQGYHLIGDASSYPSYAQVSANGNSNYVWNSSTDDPRALQEVGSSNRIAACWYGGTSSGQGFTINVSFTDGQTHQLALYLLDWDQYGGGRSEQVQIVDATTGTVLDTENAANFGNGEYLVWNVSGDIQISITSTDSFGSAVLSGLFLG
jgi:hypothetical protein